MDLCPEFEFVTGEHKYCKAHAASTNKCKLDNVKVGGALKFPLFKSCSETVTVS